MRRRRAKKEVVRKGLSFAFLFSVLSVLLIPLVVGGDVIEFYSTGYADGLRVVFRGSGRSWFPVLDSGFNGSFAVFMDFPRVLRTAVNNYSGYAYWSERGGEWERINVTGVRVKYWSALADEEVGWFGGALLRIIAPNLSVPVVINGTYVVPKQVNSIWVNGSHWEFLRSVEEVGQVRTDFNGNMTDKEFYSHFTTVLKDVGKQTYYYTTTHALVGDSETLIQFTQVAYLLFWDNWSYVRDKYLVSYVSVNGTNMTGVTVNTHYVCEAWRGDGSCVEWVPVGTWVHNVTNVTWRYVWGWKIRKHEFSYWKPALLIYSNGGLSVINLSSVEVLGVRAYLGLMYSGWVVYGGVSKGRVLLDVPISVPVNITFSGFNRVLVFRSSVSDLLEPILETVRKKVGSTVYWVSINPWYFKVKTLLVTFICEGKEILKVRPSEYVLDPNRYGFYVWRKYFGRWGMGVARGFVRVGRSVEFVFTLGYGLDCFEGVGIHIEKMLENGGWVPIMPTGLSDYGLIRNPVNILIREKRYVSLTLSILYSLNRTDLLNYGRLWGAYGFYIAGLDKYLELMNRTVYHPVNVSLIEPIPPVIPHVYATIYSSYWNDVEFIWWVSKDREYEPVVIGYDEVRWVGHYRSSVLRRPEVRYLTFESVSVADPNILKRLRRLGFRKEILALPLNVVALVYTRYWLVNSTTGVAYAWGDYYVPVTLKYTFIYSPFTGMWGVWYRDVPPDLIESMENNVTLMRILLKEGVNIVTLGDGVLLYREVGVDVNVTAVGDVIREYCLLFPPGEEYYIETRGWVLPKYTWDGSTLTTIWADTYHPKTMADAPRYIWEQLINGRSTNVNLTEFDRDYVFALVRSKRVVLSLVNSTAFGVISNLSISPVFLRVFGFNGSVVGGVARFLLNGSVYNLSLVGNASVVNVVGGGNGTRVVLVPRYYFGFVWIPWWTYWKYGAGNVTVDLNTNRYVVDGKEVGWGLNDYLLMPPYPYMIAVVGEGVGTPYTACITILENVRLGGACVRGDVTEAHPAWVYAVPLNRRLFVGSLGTVVLGGRGYFFELMPRFFDGPSLIVVRVLRGTYLLPKDSFRVVAYGGGGLEGFLTIVTGGWNIYDRSWVNVSILIGNYSVPAFAEERPAINGMTSTFTPGYTTPYYIYLRFPRLPLVNLYGKEVYVVFGFVGGGRLVWDTGLTYGDFFHALPSVSVSLLRGRGSYGAFLLGLLVIASVLYVLIDLLKTEGRGGGR